MLPAPDACIALTSACANASTLWPTPKDVTASLNDCWNAAGAASPCTIDGSSAPDPNESIDQLRYGPNFERSTSVRTGIEPLSGLNASCPDLLPIVRSQSRVASGCGAFLASVKPSATMMNDPSVPGWLTHPKSTLSTCLALTNSPCAQSPIELKAQPPCMSFLVAWSQLNAE